MKEIERINVWFGFELVNFNLSFPLTKKRIYENGRIQKFYHKLLIGINEKNQTTHEAELFDFTNNNVSNLNIGFKGFLLENLKPCHRDENGAFGVVYDKNGNIEMKIPSEYYSNIVSENCLYNFKYGAEFRQPISISKLNFEGETIWSIPHISKLNFGSRSPIRFDDENFLFYDIIEVGEHNVYTKSWLVCISNQTGQLKWKHEIEGLLAIDFLYCKDKVIVRTKISIQCYHVDNGAPVWEYKIDLEEREAFLKKWSEKVSERWLLYNGTYKFNFTIGQNDILHVLTFQKYVQIDVHTGKILNDFDYATQVAKFKFRFNASPIGNIVKVSTTHVIASVKHMAVFINMKTGLIDHHVEGEDKNGGTIMDIIIPSDNVLVLSETCATKRFPNTIVKVFESE